MAAWIVGLAVVLAAVGLGVGVGEFMAWRRWGFPRVPAVTPDERAWAIDRSIAMSRPGFTGGGGCDQCIIHRLRPMREAERRLDHE